MALFFLMAVLIGCCVSAARSEMKPMHLAQSAKDSSHPHYYDEQLLNYRLTEFCAKVPAIPAGLIASIDNAFEKDATIRPIWEWIHVVAQARQRCGDA